MEVEASKCIWVINRWTYLHFSWLPPADVMKCARNLSATPLPSVINIWHKSLLKNAFAPPVSVIAISCIGKFGMFMENALQKYKIKMQLIGCRERYTQFTHRSGGMENAYFNVANDARRFVEYNKMNPCTSSSRNAFAPWYDDIITSIFFFVSPKNVSNITLRSLDSVHDGSDMIGLKILSTENGSPQNMHKMIRMSGDDASSIWNGSSVLLCSLNRMHSMMLFKML